MDAEGQTEGKPAKKRGARGSKLMALLGIFVFAVIVIMVGRALKRSADDADLEADRD